LRLSVSGVSMSLGNGALAISNAAGDLVVRADKQGVEGSFAAAFSSTVAGLSGNLAVAFGDGTVQMTATGVSLSIAGQSIGGDMVVTTRNGAVEFEATNVSASLGGGLVTVTPPAADADVPASTLKIVNGVFRGTFSGMVAAGASSAAQFSGLVSVTVDPDDGIFATGNNNTLSIAGQTVTADFRFTKTADAFNLRVSDVDLALGNVIKITNAAGDLTVDATGVTGSATGTIAKRLAGLTGTLGVSFSPDLLSVTGTNNTLNLAGQRISGDFVFSKDSAGNLHLAADDFAADLGDGLVLVNNGSATLDLDGVSGAVSGSFAGDVSAGGGFAAGLGVGFAGRIAVVVGGGSIQARGTDNVLTIAGTSFTAGFDFFQDKDGLALNVGGVNFALGSVLSVTGAAGTLRVDRLTGVTGSTSGTVSSTLAGLSGTLGVSFAPGQLLISGTDNVLAIGGQSVGGDFAFSLTNAPTSSST
jgi:hypothetical protein